MAKELVSIIVVNYNGKEFLEEAIDSIKKSTLKKFDIIILDNASTDGSQDFIKKNYPKIKIVENKKNEGYSGINNALRFCEGRYILFLNNDIKVDKTCIYNLVKVIESNNEIGMAAPKLINYHNKNLISGGTWLSRSFYNGHINGTNISKNFAIPYLGIGLIRKDIVKKYSYLFDPDYFIYGEDVDLCLRIRLMGKKVMFVSNAVVYHMHAATASKLDKTNNTFLMERNLLTTFFKILESKNILLFLPYVFFMRFAAILRDSLSFKFNIAFARIKAISYILFTFNLILKKRQQIQKLRRVEDSYILEVFTEKYLFKPKFIV